MTPERWQRIEELVDGALEMPPVERADWLERACDGDTVLRDEVLALLEAGEREDAFLDAPLLNVAAHFADNPPEDSRSVRPDRLGPWRIVKELGRGGMGTVYLAEREEHFKQRAALKIIRRGLHLDDRLLRRFLEERQIVASLEHGSIARLLDGGLTADGIPWFAMEFVEGEPIDRWCDARRLPVEARLELFCTVCDAVEYAHARQIIHRDLKPSNILVRADGTAKLLDFGVAKLLESEDAPESEATRTGHRLLTPEYASPEQVRGEPVSNASDVYSLGVLLYELLTGRRPYRVAGRSGGEMEKAVLTQDPARPSTAVRQDSPVTTGAQGASTSPVARARGTTPERLSLRLRGELDGIVLKALSKDRAHRYGTAAALARDVRRHLEGLPVHVPRPPHRRVPAIAAAVATLIVSAVLGFRILAHRASAAAADGTVLAVGLIADHRDATGSPGASPLADLLATNLARVPALRMVSAARVYELIVAGSGGSLDAGAYSTAARRAGASMLVDGSIYSLPAGGLRLDLRRIDLTTGDVIDVHTVSGPDIFAVVDSGTVRITAAMGAAPPSGSVADVTTHSEVAYRFYEEGVRAYYRGEYPAARGLFDAALAEDSTLAMAAYYLSRASVGTDGQFVAITRALRLAERASDRERLIIRAAWATWTSDPTAIATAETLTVRYPQELDGQVYSGLAYSQAADYARALPRFRNVIAADSITPAGTGARCPACDARIDLIEAYIAMDSAAAAEREAQLWTEREPGRAEAWNLLGSMKALTGRSAEGRIAWRRAAEIDPSLNGLPGFLATFYMQDGDYETTDRELRQISQTSTTDRQAEAFWYLTISLRWQGRYAEALEAARANRDRARSVYPDRSPHLFSFQYAHVLFEMGRYAESAALFDSISRSPVGLSPSHQARYQTLSLTLGADALVAAGDTARLTARADTVRILGSQSLLGRDRMLHHHVMGMLLSARGDDEAAVAEFRLARYAPADFTRINYEMARSLMRLGRPAEAVDVLQSAIRAPFEGAHLYTTRTELEELLAKAWDALGSADSALVHYRAVQHAWRQADPILGARVAAVAARIRALDPSSQIPARVSWVSFSSLLGPGSSDTTRRLDSFEAGSEAVATGVEDAVGILPGADGPAVMENGAVELARGLEGATEQSVEIGAAHVVVGGFDRSGEREFEGTHGLARAPEHEKLSGELEVGAVVRRRDGERPFGRGEERFRGLCMVTARGEQEPAHVTMEPAVAVPETSGTEDFDRVCERSQDCGIAGGCERIGSLCQAPRTLARAGTGRTTQPVRHDPVGSATKVDLNGPMTGHRAMYVLMLWGP